MPCDIVIPIRNEQEIMEMALCLGYDSLVLAYPKAPPSPPKPIKGLQIFIASINNPAPWADICIAKAIPDSRRLLEQGSICGVYGFETASDKDFVHHRGSGLNAVLTGIAKEKKKSIILDFSQILFRQGPDRSAVLGRISQNIRLCRKAKISPIIGSFATSPFSMRAPHDLESLFIMLGMHPKEAKDGFTKFPAIVKYRLESKRGERIGDAARIV